MKFFRDQKNGIQIFLIEYSIFIYNKIFKRNFNAFILITFLDYINVKNKRTIKILALLQ